MGTSKSRKHSEAALTKKVMAVVVVAAIAMIGSVVFIASRAATSFVSVQPESGAITNPAQSINDTSASGGKAVKFAQTTVTPTPTPPSPPPSGSERNIIFDTDWWTDVDDAVAARLLAHYHFNNTKYNFNVIAATVNATLAKGPGSLDAFLLSENLKIPIGTADPNHVPNGTPPYQNRIYDNYPHDVGLESGVPSSTRVLRQALAKSPDGSVEIVSVGYLNSINELLKSPGDSISSMTGSQLIRAKVKHLWVMGGKWPSGAENNFNRTATARSAASNVVSNWPTQITFSGYEVGYGVLTGGSLKSLQGKDILADALKDHGSENGRHSWDPMKVVLAALNDPTAAGYKTVRGKASVSSSTGSNSWTNSSTGPHYYTVKTQPTSFYQNMMEPLLQP